MTRHTLLLLLLVTPSTLAQDLRPHALQALKKAAIYYHAKVASHGGYVYYYSEDLAQRWGEGKASPDLIFVQPPGTPTVGLAYLKAVAATGDRFYLDAARDAANCLVAGQLQSGGWDQIIYFAADGKRVGKYRSARMPAGNWNRSSLDDGTTQAALRFLALCDQALDFKDAAIHDAATYGHDALLKAQFANGAFPQSWQGAAADHPVVPAKYPEYDWKTEHRVRNYWDYYTLNDGLAGDVANTLLTAHAVYKDAKYKAALARLGDFLILAQMPDPQPGWCQQYDYDMHPIWARKFEPPALTGHESQDVMETLIKIAAATGDAKYLAPIPKALAYYKTCVLADGRVPRYLELRTNKPLYMDAKYQLTYDDADAPSHYGWKQPGKFDAIERAYKAAVANGANGFPPPAAWPAKPPEAKVRQAIADLDDQGRWVSTYAGEGLTGQPKFAKGFRYLSSTVFSRNLELLGEYLAATAP